MLKVEAIRRRFLVSRGCGFFWGRQHDETPFHQLMGWGCLMYFVMLPSFSVFFGVDKEFGEGIKPTIRLFLLLVIVFASILLRTAINPSSVHGVETSCLQLHQVCPAWTG